MIAYDTVPRDVAVHLGYYVYLYIDPRTNQPFYVGKGKGERVLAHLSATGESRKVQHIETLRQHGLQPRLEVLAHGLPDEETALRIEAAVIDLFGLGQLTNEVRGWKSVQFGRMALPELIAYYAAEPVEIVDPVLLIRVNQKYRHSMPAEELYEITRGVWKLGPRREGAKYACAVFEGVVKEVYAPVAWFPAGTTAYRTRLPEDVELPGRWEFAGEIAESTVRERYLNRRIESYFKKGLQNPVVYVNC